MLLVLAKYQEHHIQRMQLESHPQYNNQSLSLEPQNPGTVTDQAQCHTASKVANTLDPGAEILCTPPADQRAMYIRNFTKILKVTITKMSTNN